MGRLREMEMFVRVVEGGSFSAAAAFEFVAVYSQKAMPVTISDEVQEVLAAAFTSPVPCSNALTCRLKCRW